MKTEADFPKFKPPGVWNYLQSPSNAEFKNKWISISTSVIGFHGMRIEYLVDLTI
jgi:hypothetical protein